MCRIIAIVSLKEKMAEIPTSAWPCTYIHTVFDLPYNQWQVALQGVGTEKELTAEFATHINPHQMTDYLTSPYALYTKKKIFLKFISTNIVKLVTCMYTTMAKFNCGQIM